MNTFFPPALRSRISHRVYFLSFYGVLQSMSFSSSYYFGRAVIYFLVIFCPCTFVWGGLQLGMHFLGPKFSPWSKMMLLSSRTSSSYREAWDQPLVFVIISERDVCQLDQLANPSNFPWSQGWYNLGLLCNGLLHFFLPLWPRVAGARLVAEMECLGLLLFPGCQMRLREISTAVYLFHQWWHSLFCLSSSWLFSGILGEKRAEEFYSLIFIVEVAVADLLICESQTPELG